MLVLLGFRGGDSVLSPVEFGNVIGSSEPTTEAGYNVDNDCADECARNESQD
jgi:hypothetical protein